MVRPRLIFFTRGRKTVSKSVEIDPHFPARRLISASTSGDTRPAIVTLSGPRLRPVSLAGSVVVDIISKESHKCARRQTELANTSRWS